MRYFVTGIGTNVGKTIVSAVLTQALQADYWKPVQSGTIEGRDSETVKALISNSQTVIHPETYLLNEPLSPHFAAKLDGVDIDLAAIKAPETSNNLIIEGAGGLLVPLNDGHYVIDLAKTLDCHIILVISNYLGCINHSLLSIAYLRTQNYNLHALVFNGNFAAEVKEAIIRKAGDSRIVSIPQLTQLSKESVLKASQDLEVFKNS